MKLVERLNTIGVRWDMEHDMKNAKNKEKERKKIHKELDNLFLTGRIDYNDRERLREYLKEL